MNNTRKIEEIYASILVDFTFLIIFMKRLNSFSLLFIFICSIIFPLGVFWNNQNYFVVTAYYSPLPNQQYYSMWNYQAEVIMNGQWIAWASGRKVFSGMLAAPGGYSFGTKIFLEWLGIWSVEDRGWAIVPAGERWYKHDRIDVWMGYGDEGLRRAMYWGKRTIPGYIVKRNSNTTLNYYNIPAPSWAVSGFKNQNYVPYVPKAVELPSIFEVSLNTSSNTKLLSQLQATFSELWYLEEGYNTWKYDTETFEAVFQFQVDTWILSTKEDIGAGVYGPKTRKKFQESYDSYLEEKIKKEEFFSKLEEVTKKSEGKAVKLLEEIGIPKYGDISPVQICVKSKEELDIIITPSEVMDYLNISEDFEKESWRVHSNEIFSDYGQE